MDTSLLWTHSASTGKTFLYPRVEGDDLHFLIVESAHDLRPGKWNLHEPTGDEPRVPELVLVPGLGFDPDGHRLGRGKGFYDRWLADHSDIATLGVCFDFQIVPHIPVEPHDRRMDGVVTDQRTFP